MPRTERQRECVRIRVTASVLATTTRHPGWLTGSNALVGAQRINEPRDDSSAHHQRWKSKSWIGARGLSESLIEYISGERLPKANNRHPICVLPLKNVEGHP